MLYEVITLVPGWGGAWLLPRLIGPGPALDVIVLVDGAEEAGEIQVDQVRADLELV